MIADLYSDYDTDLTIRPAIGKTFNYNRIDTKELEKIEGIESFSKAIEEVVILKHEKKWVSANMIGVEEAFLDISKMDKHIINGRSKFSVDSMPGAIVGATLLDKLEGYVPENVGHESIICYVPKRKIKVAFGKNPFRMETIAVSGKMNFNREVNDRNFLIPIDLAKDLLEYDNQISALYLDVNDDVDNESVCDEVQAMLGKDFIVKTSFEKNELIYRTSRSEKIIVLFILLFIFILAAFNLVASLTMLFVEKLNNIGTLISFGATRQFVFRVFFYEGVLISGLGILIGLILGYGVCYLQIYSEMITMPNSGGQTFPIAISMKDGAIILSSVLLLSMVFSYFPVKFLIRRNFSDLARPVK